MNTFVNHTFISALQIGILLVFVGCGGNSLSNNSKSLTIDLAQEEGVKKLSEIKNYREIEILNITSSELTGFTAYPPLTSLEQSVPGGSNSVVLKELPREICELTNLKSLSLAGLGLQSLPHDFGKLEELEVLNLSFNNLAIEKELDKIKALEKLKKIHITGNKGELEMIQQWQQENPDLEIIYM